MQLRVLFQTLAFAFWTIQAGACQGPVWGEGAVELPDTNARIIGGIERHVDRAGLAAVSETLTAATTALREAGFALGQTQGVDFGSGAMPVTRFDLQLSEKGLVLRVEVPPTTLAWNTRSDTESIESICIGQMTIGPGSFAVAIDFATDKLGRIQAVAQERALWDGPLVVKLGEPASGMCNDFDNTWFADLMTRRVVAWTGGDIATMTTRLLGFSLAAALGQPRNSEERTFRAHVRARNEAPVSRRDDGISAFFELQLQSDVAGCLAPYAFATGRDESLDWNEAQAAPGGSSVSIPTAAIAASIEAWVLHGGLCGREEAPAGATAVLESIPSWKQALAGDVIDDIQFEMQPHGPPDISATDVNTLIWRQAAVDIELHGRWGGARWRLGTMAIAVTLELRFMVGPDGWVVGELAQAGVEVIETNAGLLPAIGIDDARAVVEHIGTELAGDRPLLRLPDAIAPDSIRNIEFGDDGRTARITAL